MANNLHIEIDPEEFKALKDSEKLHAIYKAILSHEPRICKLEKRRIKDSGFAITAGTIAGFLGGILKGKL